MTDHGHRARATGRDQVIQDRVDRVFIEDASIAIIDQVKFQALKFNARDIGHIRNNDCGEIRLTCLRADGCKFGTSDFNQIIAIRKLVRKGFE